MTHEEKRKFMLQITDETESTACRADLFYVICFWHSPITDNIEFRRAYFDDVSEAISYDEHLRSIYRDNFNFKYFTTTNVFSGDTDGGLLDD